MVEATLEWRTYRYFPYERDFARLEVERLFRAAPREAAGGLRIPGAAFRYERADRLTYFARAIHPSGKVVVPRQTRLEASVAGDDSERQATRYSSHGLHEYKGKFNPQVVRAIGNILALDQGATVLDPFCGSGTTLLECAHAGWNGVGVDRNPLAVHITNAKLVALRRADGRLQEMVGAVTHGLAAYADRLCRKAPAAAKIESTLGVGWDSGLPSREYLRAWFPMAVLAQVVAIQRVLRQRVRSPEDRAVFEVILSDHLRKASLQEPADLRIRRRKAPEPNYPILEWFLRALSARIERVARARRALGEIPGEQRAHLGDIRFLDFRHLRGIPNAGVDAVITSPPYETALPYIDTQRLSLVLLGDIDASEVQATEKALIGARDLATSERRMLEAEIRKGTAGLPSAVVELCRELLDAAGAPGNGFRRVNRPALVYRYFKSMAQFFLNVRRALRPGGRLALVVGTNRTVLGGREFVIDTPRLLAEVGRYAGYAKEDERRMDTYQRYDLHQRNSIDAEMLIVLTAQ